MTDWTEAMIAKLQALWNEGHSTAQIGLRIGLSKSSICGKAHRMNLPTRTSPIIRNGKPAAPKVRRLNGPRDPATPVPIEVIRQAQLQGPAYSESIVAQAERAARTDFKIKPCCWPIGEPGKQGFHFCEADAPNGRPYCPDHSAIAYVRVRDRREDWPQP